MKCVICEARKARRYCPGVKGEICTICCGTERENTVDCPLDCIYLREARLHEKPVEVDPANIPFSELKVPSRYIEEHKSALQLVVEAVVEGILKTPDAIDFDVREALESLIRTYKTLESGLIYETRPTANLAAAGIYIKIQQNIAERRKALAAKMGTSLPDGDVLSALLLLQRHEYRLNNGRKKGRAFIDQMLQKMPAREQEDLKSERLII